MAAVNDLVVEEDGSRWTAAPSVGCRPGVFGFEVQDSGEAGVKTADGYSSITERMLPAGSVNQAIGGPSPAFRAVLGGRSVRSGKYPTAVSTPSMALSKGVGCTAVDATIDADGHVLEHPTAWNGLAGEHRPRSSPTSGVSTT